ncbi:hypothetical protein HG535_0D04860 [Zygotorulaspora mrakii]|uniref:Pre-mRNA-splicing factor SYF1 n=1 Tax=Zygotorulaspora mrakii TaxID=42260 RepID=A0A7H9B2R0_ZYGMR|nr:uncharacterized protein HG535_0D04860 [Zygotorulaspora mrakii]QLG72777.1 hypothetical protein HG535_0D04860 [Zygotorulaspora mrakii]
MEEYITDSDDIAFEYELQSTPNNKVTWKRYLDSWKSQYNKKKSVNHIVWLYERFCLQFTRDLEAWEEYIKWVLDSDMFEYHAITNLFKRCLANFSHKCDRICLMFLKFAIAEYDLSVIRVALDESLSKISRDSHAKVWGLLLPFICQTMLPLSRIEHVPNEGQYEELLEVVHRCLFKNRTEIESHAQGDMWSAELLVRYLEVCPKDKIPETLIYLSSTGVNEVVVSSFDRYIGKNENISPDINLQYQIYTSYLKALKQLRQFNEYKEFSAKVQTIFPHQKFTLIVELVRFYIKEARLKDAENLLKSSLADTLTVRDFAAIYDFHIDYEKACAEVILQELDTPGVELRKDLWEPILISHMNNLETLTKERELKLNDLKLRQNSNVVNTWLERASLFHANNEKCDVFAQAILQIDPSKIITPGSFGELWCRYAALYWEAGQYENAREVWDRGLRVPYVHMEDLEKIWDCWVNHELELGPHGMEKAIKLLETALEVPENPDLQLEKYKKGKKKMPSQIIVFSSLCLWNLLLDLVESFCDRNPEEVGKVINIYEQVIMLKVATPLIFINYAHFLQKYKSTEAGFQVYERAIATFPPETQFEIWNMYLAEGMDKNAPLSTEHIRDLFDQALETLLPNKIDCKAIFILYSDFEEKNGFANRSVEILFQGCKCTEDIESRLSLWKICLSKAKSLLGEGGSRKLYEECIQSMPNSKIIGIVIDFAETETRLNEIDRAREIFRYGAQLLPPQKNINLWGSWDEFELQHGDKETYKEMLKLKKNLENEMLVDTESESKFEGNVAFVSASNSKAVNPEEIELDL